MINFQMVLEYQKDLTKLGRVFCSSKDESVMLQVANLANTKGCKKPEK